MFESKYSKLLTILLILGIVTIIGVLLFLGISMIHNNSLNNDAQDAAEQFQNKINNISNNKEENVEIVNDIAPIIGVENIITDNNSSDENNLTYKGFPCIGTIEIPATNLKCPILAETSTKEMEVAVCLYDGPGLNQIGNTTIAGHNYRNGTFFSNNKKLVEGDKIYITDTTGQKVTYIIYKTYITSPEDSSYLDRDTEGKREISLTTCTDDAQSRLIIWAKEQ